MTDDNAARRPWGGAQQATGSGDAPFMVWRMTQAPPGWYPDPAPVAPGTPPHHRYWDGAGWTAHVQPVYPAYAQPVQRYAQPVQPRIVAGPTTPEGERLAGWWWRALAQVIDIVILGVAGNIVALPVQIQVQREIADLTDRYVRDVSGPNGQAFDLTGYWQATVDIYRDHIIGLFVVPLLFGLAYICLFLRWKGATPGKLVCGLRVRLRERPGRLPWSAIAIRATVQHLIPGMAVAALILSGSLATMVLGYLGVTAYFLVDVLWAAVEQETAGRPRHRGGDQRGHDALAVEPPAAARSSTDGTK